MRLGLLLALLGGVAAAAAAATEASVGADGGIEVSQSPSSVSIVLIGATGSLARKYLVQVRMAATRRPVFECC